MASPRVPPCQTGRMTLSSLVSRLTSPRSAYSGHGFLIKAGLTTTTPYGAPRALYRWSGKGCPQQKVRTRHTRQSRQSLAEQSPKDERILILGSMRDKYIPPPRRLRHHANFPVLNMEYHCPCRLSVRFRDGQAEASTEVVHSPGDEAGCREKAHGAAPRPTPQPVRRAIQAERRRVAERLVGDRYQTSEQAATHL